MKRLLKLTACILVLAIGAFISCNKELKCYDCKENKPPIANGGRDTTIISPKDSTMLDGSASTDPDGTITSYKWVKVSGPLSSNLTKPDSLKTIVKGLTAGVYQFELTVTDNGGLSAKDTTQVKVTAPGNQPPVACAGPDKTITLPTDTVTLDGSCSADPNNNITSYLWTKIAGPAANITNSNSVLTEVSGSVQGIYQFELKVTDAGGLSSKDTVQVTVNAVVAYSCGDTNRPHINTQFVQVTTLPEQRTGMAVAASGNKIVFAGGSGPTGALSSRVDIYDLTTQTWAIAKLGVARYDPAAVAAANKIFFAGGETSDGTFPTSAVDIYDVLTGTWTATALSMPANGLAPAVVGNKVLFAGGDAGFTSSWPGNWERNRRVDIYDLTTNTFSISTLPDVKRGGHVAVTLNKKVYFSGGETWPDNPVPGTWFISKTIDVYDNATNSWSTSSLTEGKLGHAGIAVNDKIFWAGGETGSFPNISSSCSVEVQDVKSGKVSIQMLSSPGYRTAVLKNNQIIFYGGNDKFDIYDVTTDKWSIGIFPFPVKGASIISVNNSIYIAGGTVNGVLSNKVYKLDF